MSKVAQQLIASFEALVQLLQRIIGAPCSSPSDEELAQVADLVFQEYDRHEAHG